MKLDKTVKRLDDYDFSTKRGFNGRMLKLRYRALSPYFRGDSCLEVGCGDGEGTKILMKHFKRVVAVDGSKRLLKDAAEGIKSPRVLFVHSLFEELKIDERFDTIVLGHILEHVDDPVRVLRHIRKFVQRDGRFIIDVPNAFSIHRQLGVILGLIKNVYSLNEFDKSVGHRRVYDLTTVMRDVRRAGLQVKETGGIFLKLFSNAQMEEILQKKIFDVRHLPALTELGKKYPDVAAELYLICTYR